MTNKEPKLLFIPDISGFTDFVNNTEISHSRHIISELLEVIINSDKSGMSVSEIERDAVLFFKDSTISVYEIIDQCETTFKNFHSHLQKYDTERICRCGACETASNLSLKFIVHSGEIEIINIKEHQKLHGSDVILAHRLLKNSIKEREYILLSDNFMSYKNDQINKSANWIEIQKGQDSFDGIGAIDYSFISLTNLPLEPPDNKSLTFPILDKERISLQKTINANVDIVYEYYTNFEKRLQWNEEIKEIILHGSKLNKTGSLHSCLIGNNTLNMKTIGRLEDKDSIVYGERLNKFKGLRDIISIYTFEKKGEKTIVNVDIDYKIQSWLGKLQKPMVHKMLKKQTENVLMRLKKISEENPA